MEKLTLSLAITSKKFRPYFQVLTNFSLGQLFHKLDSSGKPMKWAIKLSGFNILYKPWTFINGQVLVDFITEFKDTPDIKMAIVPIDPLASNLFVDGSFGEMGSIAGWY